MPGKPNPSASKIGPAIAKMRAGGYEWGSIQERFNLTRQQCWRIAKPYMADEPLSEAATTLDHATHDRKGIQMIDQIACQTCPHWSRRKEPTMLVKGFCAVKREGGDPISTGEESYCLDHPVLVLERETTRANLLGAAMARAFKEAMV